MRDKVAPHIGVTVGLGAIHGEPGALPAVSDSGSTLLASLVRRWWCDTPWSTCKTTSLADTVLLCEQTFHDLHEGHHTLELKDGRYLSPNGWANGPSG